MPQPALAKAAPQPVLTRIASKFQVTVPCEIRDAFGLEEGDLLEWVLMNDDSIHVYPKRPQLITPLLTSTIEEARQRRAKSKR
jgi:AbrB family looped-hinge helix DNA binding protein